MRVIKTSLKYCKKDRWLLVLFRESLPKLNGSFRLFHAAANAPSIDVYSNGNLISENLSFSMMTDYMTFPAGNYEIQAFTSGTYDTPIYTQTIEVIPNEISTLNFVLLESTLSIFTLKDASSSASSGPLSFLRFINLSPNAPLLTLSLPNEEKLFNSVEYLETTGYYTLSPGLYNFLLTASESSFPEKFINDLNLKPSSFHTIYIIGLIDNLQPPLGYYFSVDGKD